MNHMHLKVNIAFVALLNFISLFTFFKKRYWPCCRLREYYIRRSDEHYSVVYVLSRAYLSCYRLREGH